VPSALNCDDITNAGLVCNLVEQCDNSVAAGGVISQDPAAGTMVAPDSTVTLVISTGPCPQAVPNVAGMSQAAAESAITGAGFNVGSVTEECSDTVAAGNVISQDPAGGTEADLGTSVNLVVSTGPCQVAVPSALNCDDITNAGLVCNLVEQCDNSVAAGGVISQDPVPGTMVATGSTVTLVVSTGQCNEEPVAVDDEYSIDEDNTLTVPDSDVFGVLDNDTDADDDSLTAVLMSGPSNGTLAFNADGFFTYTPNVNFNGNDSFTYAANDGLEDSNTATVTITINPVNDAPVADAGLDQADVSPGDVPLNGSGTDVDEDQLTFNWTIISEPYAEAGQLNDANLVNPTLVVDGYGLYEIRLEVCDEDACASDTVQIATEGNLKPVANAGEDKTVGQYDYVCLDGSASSDPNGDDITYAWTITSMPDGSEAMLDNSVAVDPCFTPDKVGDYMVKLIVNDGEYDSDPDTVTISVEGNSKPVADAGENRDVNVGEEVCLDGGESSDPDGDNITTYSWAITSRPVGSDANEADLYDPGKVNPCFRPDVPGTYVVQLTVTDEHGLSGEPVTVTITATEGEEPALGDLNGDNVVDMADLNIILSHRNQPADVCPECDLDGDGMITALDARKLVLLCTCPRCICP
jgi:VCBS repeat-containing protein